MSPKAVSLLTVSTPKRQPGLQDRKSLRGATRGPQAILQLETAPHVREATLIASNRLALSRRRYRPFQPTTHPQKGDRIGRLLAPIACGTTCCSWASGISAFLHQNHPLIKDSVSRLFHRTKERGNDHRLDCLRGFYV